MSTDWDVRCLDCAENHGFEDANHEVQLMVTVARSGRKLAQLAGVVRKIQESTHSDVSLKLGLDRLRVDLAWFEKHGTHRLIAVNEYGRCFDECGIYFSCGECHRDRQCHRPDGHEGEHSEERDK